MNKSTMNPTKSMKAVATTIRTRRTFHAGVLAIFDLGYLTYATENAHHTIMNAGQSARYTCSYETKKPMTFRIARRMCRITTIKWRILIQSNFEVSKLSRG